MLKGYTILATVLITAALSSCMVGPDYKTPETAIAEQWNTDKKGVSTAAVENTAWWKSFNDPVLTALIEEGYAHNLSLQTAGANVLQAKAQLAQSKGELFPQQQYLTASYTHQELGSGSQFNLVIPSNFNSSAASLNASWEADFWGKYRRAIHANDANFLASLAAYDNALVTLTAEIGSRYVAIRTYQAQIALTKKNIKLQKDSLVLSKNRYQEGEDSLSNVQETVTTLNQTEASLPTLYSKLQQEKDALAVLLGTTPDKVDALLGTSKGIPVAPKTIAVGIPKDILRQRPDVREAEYQAITQSENIGAVKAQLYPALSLVGSFGYSASTVGDSSTTDIFQWSNHTLSIGPSLSLPLLNYGQISNQVRAQDAIFQQAIFNYQNTVLNAQKEVQDGIASYVESQRSLKAMQAANTSARKAVELMRVRYETGEVDYADVLNTEQQQLSVENSLINAQGSVPQGLISLYRALGGGWQIRQGHDVLPNSVKQQMADRTNWGDLLDQPQ